MDIILLKSYNNYIFQAQAQALTRFVPISFKGRGTFGKFG